MSLKTIKHNKTKSNIKTRTRCNPLKTNNFNQIRHGDRSGSFCYALSMKSRKPMKDKAFHRSIDPRDHLGSISGRGKKVCPIVYNVIEPVVVTGGGRASTGNRRTRPSAGASGRGLRAGMFPGGEGRQAQKKSLIFRAPASGQIPTSGHAGKALYFKDLG